jgi:hypothetical protein
VENSVASGLFRQKQFGEVALGPFWVENKKKGHKTRHALPILARLLSIY